MEQNIKCCRILGSVAGRLGDSTLTNFRTCVRSFCSVIYQAKANLDEKILLGRSTHQLDPETKKMLVMCKFGNKDSTFLFCP